jgi:alpha-ketoglutarate-dependent taurine dioxygenase
MPTHGTSTTDQLVAAAKAVTLTFEDVPHDPQPIADFSDIRPEETRAILERYARNGFAVLELDRSQVGPDTVMLLGHSLGMGKPFLPPLYTKGGNEPPPVTRISATLNLDTADADHPSFGRTVGQHLHCDGTLQKIGLIKTSVLLCESVAAEGGDTMLFNSSAAFARLVDEDLDAAVALATPGVLVRQANVNACTDTNVGPAFTVQEGRLVCGYSVTETDSWAVPDGVAEHDLRRGVEFLREASRPGSPYYLQLRLAPGEAILLDNTRISHGRTAYRDSPAQRRCLYRSLHLAHPRVRTLEPVAAGKASPGSGGD